MAREEILRQHTSHSCIYVSVYTFYKLNLNSPGLSYSMMQMDNFTIIYFTILKLISFVRQVNTARLTHVGHNGANTARLTHPLDSEVLSEPTQVSLTHPLDSEVLSVPTQVSLTHPLDSEVLQEPTQVSLTHPLDSEVLSRPTQVSLTHPIDDRIILQ